MTSHLDFLAFFTCAAMTMFPHCKADWPPPPTGLTYQWLDPFTVNVSWQKPHGLPDGEVLYKYFLESEPVKSLTYTIWRNFTDSLYTEQTGSDHWTYVISTVGDRSCLNESTPMNITIRTPKPRVELKDIRCFTYPKEMNCSWTPGSQSFNLSYRICGHYAGYKKGLRACNQPYSSATRNGCHLKANAMKNDICMYVDTAAGLSTFKNTHASSLIHSPKLSVREDRDKLILSWKPPEFIKGCILEYEVCDKQCNKPKVCWKFISQDGTKELAYDKSCQYEFQSRVSTKNDCRKIFSDFGDVVRHGTNEPPDHTLIVVAIVVPIILSLCIILSCYCFRRHSSIICPIIPDPSAIFKEMMLNGNKELKPTLESLYTPVPEPVEPCKVTLVTENSVLQQNS